MTIRLNRTAYTIIGVLPERAGVWGGSVMVPFQLDLAAQDVNGGREMRESDR